MFRGYESRLAPSCAVNQCCRFHCNNCDAVKKDVSLTDSRFGSCISVPCTRRSSRRNRWWARALRSRSERWRHRRNNNRKSRHTREAVLAPDLPRWWALDLPTKQKKSSWMTSLSCWFLKLCFPLVKVLNIPPPVPLSYLCNSQFFLCHWLFRG